MPVPRRAQPIRTPGEKGWAWRAACVLAVSASLLRPGVAGAEEPAAPATVAESAPPDRVVPETAAEQRIDRTWAYADDARIPAPLSVIATTGFSYTSVGNSPTRVSYTAPDVPACITQSGQRSPCYSGLAANTAQPGGAASIGGELGLFPRVSLQALAVVGLGGVEGAPGLTAGGTASLRVSVLPEAWRHLHLVLSGGYVREAWAGPIYSEDSGKWLPGSPSGDNGMFFQAAVSGDVQRLRLVGNVHGEHIFADGRDPLDVMVDIGASYRLVGTFRAGVEYVGQDLEEAVASGAEGGARHFVGPIASLQLFRERLTIVAGPSVGLSRLSPDFVGRVGASLGF